jgi:adenylate kinase family enzyme
MTTHDARRILVAGTSGSGKTTLAAHIARIADVPHTEIDALFHHAGWTPNPRFEDEVRELVAGDAWVTELQYPTARPLLAARAQLLVWLDLPRRVVLPRIVRRTVSRSLRRTELWNGNVEAPLRTFFTDPEHIVRYSMQTHGLQATRVREALRANPGLRLVRLRTARDTARFLALLDHEHHAR